MNELFVSSVDIAAMDNFRLLCAQTNLEGIIHLDNGQQFNITNYGHFVDQKYPDAYERQMNALRDLMLTQMQNRKNGIPPRPFPKDEINSNNSHFLVDKIS